MSADANPSVIRRTHGTEESPNDRLMKKHVPAWVVSGAVHVVLVAVLLLIDLIMPSKPPAVASDYELATTDQQVEEPKANLTETTIGLDPDTIPAIVAEKLDEQNIVDKVTTESPGNDADRKSDYIPPPGVTAGDTGGVAGDIGNLFKGDGGGALGESMGGMAGRGAATRSKLVAQGGGNSASEAAVARGLAWLAKQQKGNGSWVWDGSHSADTVSATGLALLPFLAAGQTHKPAKDNKYRANVEAGLKFVLANQKPDGSFNTSSGMYAHAIITVALCEALGMTGDRSLLQKPAQAAVNYIIRAQGTNGSWGYSFGSTGDTSIVGWQIQALHSAKLCKELVVDKRTIDRAMKFLDSVATGSDKAKYGYTTPGATPTLSAVGLLCRYYENGWGPNNPGLAGGVQYLMKSHMPAKGRMDMYYYYYATQVVHFFEGPEWHKDWNPKMRDMLIDLQVAENKANAGSWDPDGDMWIGGNCGRVGMTCMCLLTLEVYYRHLPLYKRDAGGLQEVDRVK